MENIWNRLDLLAGAQLSHFRYLDFERYKQELIERDVNYTQEGEILLEKFIWGEAYETHHND